MESPVQHRVSRVGRRAASALPTLVVVLVLTILATPWVLGQTFKVLHAFTGEPNDGNSPQSDAILDQAGNLYSTTYAGGKFNNGVVFKLSPSGKVTLLHEFGAKGDGTQPKSGVVLDKAGNLYGTTSSGGRYDHGTVFRLDKTGKETLLHTFTGGADGDAPEADLVQDAEGNLYGTTQAGGDTTCAPPYGCGVVFKLDKTGREKVLHAFTSSPDGEGPQGSVVFDKAGNLYGTTAQGGNDVPFCGGWGPIGCGVVYKIDKTGKETVLYTFTGGPDGATPFANLVLDTEGNLYGTAFSGGVGGACQNIYGCGTVFKVSKTGKLTLLYSFTGLDGMGHPFAGVIRGSAGNLYGATTMELGSVFKLDTTGAMTVLYRFTGGMDGDAGIRRLFRDAEGNLYGLGVCGGNARCPGGDGTVYRITP